MRKDPDIDFDDNSSEFLIAIYDSDRGLPVGELESIQGTKVNETRSNSATPRK